MGELTEEDMEFLEVINDLSEYKKNVIIAYLKDKVEANISICEHSINRDKVKEAIELQQRYCLEVDGVKCPCFGRLRFVLDDLGIGFISGESEVK